MISSHLFKHVSDVVIRCTVVLPLPILGGCSNGAESFFCGVCLVNSGIIAEPNKHARRANSKAKRVKVISKHAPPSTVNNISMSGPSAALPVCSVAETMLDLVSWSRLVV